MLAISPWFKMCVFIRVNIERRGAIQRCRSPSIQELWTKEVAGKEKIAANQKDDARTEGDWYHL